VRCAAAKLCFFIIALKKLCQNAESVSAARSQNRVKTWKTRVFLLMPKFYSVGLTHARINIISRQTT
jgi:hypothetical protein